MKLPIENILRRPRITEKATVLSGRENAVYTFEVSTDANKKQIAEAVEHYFKVKPVKVNIVNLPAKNVFVRRTRGTTAGIKKALVFLKKGDNIDFV